jgi:hypothetical protein
MPGLESQILMEQGEREGGKQRLRVWTRALVRGRGKCGAWGEPRRQQKRRGKRGEGEPVIHFTSSLFILDK